MKVNYLSTTDTSFARVPSGAGDDELKRRRLGLMPAALPSRQRRLLRCAPRCRARALSLSLRLPVGDEPPVGDLGPLLELALVAFVAGFRDGRRLAARLAPRRAG